MSCEQTPQYIRKVRFYVQNLYQSRIYTEIQSEWQKMAQFRDSPLTCFRRDSYKMILTHTSPLENTTLGCPKCKKSACVCERCFMWERSNEKYREKKYWEKRKVMDFLYSDKNKFHTRFPHISLSLSLFLSVCFSALLMHSLSLRGHCSNYAPETYEKMNIPLSVSISQSESYTYYNNHLTATGFNINLQYIG